MTAPRQLLPGTVYLVTRRCAQRDPLLRPSKLTNEVFAYLLAIAARRYAVDLHAYCVLSNHYHLVVTDRQARLPAFQQFLDGLVARAINALYGRWEAFWAPNSYSAVALASPSDVVDKVAYTLANPVAARIVRRGRLWPGLWSPPQAIGGGGLEVSRPNHFFDSKGPLPASLRLRLVVPAGFASAEAFRTQVAASLAAREDAVAEEHPSFLGVRRALAQRVWPRPRPVEPRRRLRPRVAARDRWKRMELLGRLKSFLAAHRSALLAWRLGERSAVFPAGTYLMRVTHGVACAGAG